MIMSRPPPEEAKTYDFMGGWIYAETVWHTIVVYLLIHPALILLLGAALNDHPETIVLQAAGCAIAYPILALFILRHYTHYYADLAAQTPPTES